MILGINGATTENCSLEEDIAIAGKAGYQVVELRYEKMLAYLKNKSFADLKQELSVAKVQPYTINAIGMSTMQTAEKEAEILELTEKFTDFAAKIDCPWIVACPGKKSENTSWDEIITKSSQTLAKMADIAWKKRICLSFEFLGFGWCSVQTVSEAYAIIKAANRSNLGITIDTAHFYSGSSNLAEISALPKEKLAVFHINDVRKMPKNEVGDYDRVMPGEGVIELKNIWQEVCRIGYNGVVSLEIFNHDYNKQDPLVIAKKGIEKIQEVLK